MPIEDIVLDEVPLDVAGTIGVTGSVSVGNIPWVNIQGRRDSDGVYTPIVVSDDGAIDVNVLNAEPISGTFTPVVPTISVSGNITSTSQVVQLSFEGRKSAAFVLDGTWTGRVVLDSTCDGVTWVNTWFTLTNNDPVTFGIPVPVISTSGNGTYKITETAGVDSYRVRATSLSDGTVNATIVATESEGGFKYVTGSIIQNVAADSNNSFNQSLAMGASISGVASSTLGVAGIQVSLKSDQNCTVYVDQSPDGTNWDITDSYTYYYSLGGAGWTTQAINSYYRVRVTNTGTTTATYLRLQTALCPIVEALPRALSHDGALKVDVTGFHGENIGEAVNVSPAGEMMVAEHSRLVGTSFTGTILDPNFWITPTKTGSAGVIVASGMAQLYTGATANSSVVLNSNRVARYIAGTPNYYRGAVNCPAITGANVRRWGAFDALDGYFYEYDGTTLSVVARRNGSDSSKISSGSFNGTGGATYTLDANVHTFEIFWTSSNVWFCIDEVLIHKIKDTLVPSTYTQHLRVGLQCTNSDGNVARNTLNVRTSTINRMGKLESTPHWYNITSSETRVLKYGPGSLHRIVCNDIGAAGNTLVLYDGISAVGYPTIASLDLNKSTIISLDYNLPFSSGLTYTSNSSVNMTVVYE